MLPLDADDLIEGTTISRLEAVFDSVDDPSIGWLYGDGTLFGTYEAMARMPRRFTRFRLRQHNLCFSASFIHRRIFDAGLRYDETLLNGFEDWEFYLHASELGFRGVHVGDYGFHYRKHGMSMLAGSRLRAEETYLDIMARHPASFERHEMALAEHAELPRFAVFDIDRGEIEYLLIARPAASSGARCRRDRWGGTRHRS